MSGGSFEYNQRAINEFADSLEELININGIERLDEYDEDQDFNFSGDTISEFKQALRHLRKAFIYAQRIDWLVSGDDGEDSFHERLQQELGEL